MHFYLLFCMPFCPPWFTILSNFPFLLCRVFEATIRVVSDYSLCRWDIIINLNKSHNECSYWNFLLECIKLWLPTGGRFNSLQSHLIMQWPLTSMINPVVLVLCIQYSVSSKFWSFEKSFAFNIIVSVRLLVFYFFHLN